MILYEPKQWAEYTYGCTARLERADGKIELLQFDSLEMCTNHLRELIIKAVTETDRLLVPADMSQKPQFLSRAFGGSSRMDYVFDDTKEPFFSVDIQLHMPYGSQLHLH